MSIIKKVRYYLPLIILTMILQTGTAQQESQFTQFMYNQLAFNPAYAGATDKTTLTALYRNQWMGFDGAPVAKLISLNTSILDKKVGFGLSVVNQTIGITNNWNASMAYSYQLKVTDDLAFRFGLQGALRYYGFDFEDPQVVIRDSGDPSLSANMERKYTGNFGMGVYVTYDWLYFGASVPFFFPNEITLNRQTATTLVAEEVPHFHVIAGADIPANENLRIQPNLLFKYVENAPVEFDLNLNLEFNRVFTLGASARLGGDGASGLESIDLLAMYRYNNIGFGIAYDINMSEISDYSNGSIEAMVRYQFSKNQDNIANPRFFE